jgi:hypothetical protein
MRRLPAAASAISALSSRILAANETENHLKKTCAFKALRRSAAQARFWHALRMKGRRGSGVSMPNLNVKSCSLLSPRQSVVREGRGCRFSLLGVAIGMALLIFAYSYEAVAASRLKDMVNFEGVRDNILVG